MTLVTSPYSRDDDSREGPTHITQLLLLHHSSAPVPPCFLPTSSRRQLPGHRGSVWSLLSPQRPACACMPRRGRQAFVSERWTVVEHQNFFKTFLDRPFQRIGTCPNWVGGAAQRGAADPAQGMLSGERRKPICVFRDEQ